jgi:3D (Asp-Asp-Asp) domain-containing protein
MRPLPTRISVLALCIFIAGCASRPLPRYETPIARTQVQHVRTTAYTDTEEDHKPYTNHNALGGILQSGQIHSAAADWSRWPAGTIFRIRETGEIYQVDDYGWALSGTNTIDLYKPSRETMNAWGVQKVTIENLQWGNPKQSLAILRDRSHYRHVRRMIGELENRMAELEKPVPSMGTAPEPVMIASAPSPAPTSGVVIQPFTASTASSSNQQTTPRAIPVSASRTTSVARDPFFSNGGSGR